MIKISCITDSFILCHSGFITLIPCILVRWDWLRGFAGELHFVYSSWKKDLAGSLHVYCSDLSTKNQNESHTKISESVFSGCASPRERAAIGMPWKNWTWSMRINWGRSICNQSVSGRQKAATGHDSVISQQLKCWAYLQRVKCTKFIIMISLPSSLHFWLQMDEYIFLQGLRYQYIQKCFYLWCQSLLYLANNYAWVLESAELFLLFLLKY